MIPVTPHTASGLPAVEALGPGASLGHPILSDLYDGLYRYQEAFLRYPQKAPGAHLKEAHLAFLPVYVEVLNAAYTLPLCVEYTLASEVIVGVGGHEIRVA
jgi:hypothetical protein